MEQLRIPALLDEEFAKLLQVLKEADITSVDDLNEVREYALVDSRPARPSAEKAPVSSDSELTRSFPAEVFWSSERFGNTLYISNMVSTTDSVNKREPDAQMAKIVHRLLSLLQNTYHVTSSSIIFSTLLLRSMADFTTINSVYGSLFTEPNPPARVTVACGDASPDNVEVMLSVVVDLGPVQVRKGLHVQSRSYWAPANIGPYSQAIAVPVTSGAITDYHSSQYDIKALEVVYVAGQIPLVPASMELVGDNGTNEFGLQTVLALQHLWRIGRTMNVVWWTAGIAFISKCGPEEAKERARTALKAWKSIHQLFHEEQNERMEPEDEDTADVWDMKHGMGARAGTANGPSTDGRPRLPDYNRVFPPSSASTANQILTPPCFVVQVGELPRGADIEWTSIGLAADRVELRVTKRNITGAEGGRTSFQWIPITEPTDVNAINESEDTVEHYTIYSAQPLPLLWLDRVKPRVIPCDKIWGDDGIELAAVVANARPQQNRQQQTLKMTKLP